MAEGAHVKSEARARKSFLLYIRGTTAARGREDFALAVARVWQPPPLPMPVVSVRTEIPARSVVSPLRCVKLS